MVGWHYSAIERTRDMAHEYIYHRHLVVIVSGTVDHVTQTAMVRRPGDASAVRVPLASLVIRDLVS
jgi:hypothetical protein